jgi:hypothetical protein
MKTEKKQQKKAEKQALKARNTNTINRIQDINDLLYQAAGLLQEISDEVELFYSEGGDGLERDYNLSLLEASVIDHIHKSVSSSQSMLSALAGSVKESKELHY